MTYRGHHVLSTLIRCHFSPVESTGGQYVYTGGSNGVIWIYHLDGRVVQGEFPGFLESRQARTLEPVLILYARQSWIEPKRNRWSTPSRENTTTRRPRRMWSPSTTLIQRERAIVRSGMSGQSLTLGVVGCPRCDWSTDAFSLVFCAWLYVTRRGFVLFSTLSSDLFSRQRSPRTCLAGTGMNPR